MSTRSDSFIRRFIIPHEAEYQNGQVITEHDPSDPGGATRYGIDQRSHPGINIDSLSLSDAVLIYQSEWDKGCFEEMDAQLGEARFNTRVNAGAGQDKLCDDRMDLARHIEAWSIDVGQMEASVYIDEVEDFYKKLAAAKPNFARYLKGWLNRLVDLRAYLNLPPRAQPV